MIFRSKDRARSRKRGQTGIQAAKDYRFGNISGAKGSPFQKNSRPVPASRKWLGRAVDVVILTAVVGLLAYSLIVKPTPNVSVSDVSYHDKKTYEQAALDEFRVFRNRNKITFNEQQIADNLRDKFPEISNVTIELPLIGQTPAVKIEIAKPSLKLLSGGQAYVINSQGVVTGLTGDLPGTRDLVEVADQSGYGVQTGKPVLEASAVAFIEALTAQLRQSKVPTSSLTLPAKAQELDLRTADQPYYVKFYLGGDAATQIGQLLATRNQFARDGIQPNDYLDVRVQGKIFYK